MMGVDVMSPTCCCRPLRDAWLQDGYDVNPDNSDDAIRNGIGQRAIWGLARVAELLGQPEAAARYNTMATAITAGMKAHLLRYNASEAYFVDGAVGNSTGHAAIHSTLYAVAAGAADNDTALAAMVRFACMAPMRRVRCWCHLAASDAVLFATPCMHAGHRVPGAARHWRFFVHDRQMVGVCRSQAQLRAAAAALVAIHLLMSPALRHLPAGSWRLCTDWASKCPRRQTSRWN